MNVKSFFEIIERISKHWEKRSGLFLTILLINLCYFYFLNDSDALNFTQIQWIKTVLIPITISIIIFFYWLLQSKRFYIRKGEQLVLGLIINIDENEIESKIKKIINTCLTKIDLDYKDIKILFYPINFKTDKKQVEKYLKSHFSSIDVFLFAKVESGKIKSLNTVEETIRINQISFIGNFNVHQNLRVFKSTINMAKDLEIRYVYKDWAYIEDNSLNDKKKLQLNFKDTILHYCGIYLIYLGEYQSALSILKTLFNPILSEVDPPVNGKLTISKEALAAGRLNNIILNLFYETSSRLYQINDKKEEAYLLLKECEKIFKHHNDSYSHYIPLARISYELDNLTEAKEYTLKAKKLSGWTIEVILNYSFFAILEGNIKDLGLFTRKLINKDTPYNYADIVWFLDKEREKVTNNTELFDFQIATINTNFLDKNLGKEMLKEFIRNYEYKVEYSPLISIAKELLNTKQVNFKKLRKNKRRKR